MSNNHSALTRLAAAVADLGHPFYAEERQRDVWNEASAFGFQLLLWGGTLLAAVMVWVGGAPLVWWALALLVLNGAASYGLVGYARHLGVEVSGKGSLNGRRLAVYSVLLVVLVVGVARAQQIGDGAGAWSLSGMALGMAIGLGGVLGMWIGTRRQERRSRAAAADPDAHGPVSRPGL